MVNGTKSQLTDIYLRLKSNCWPQKTLFKDYLSNDGNGDNECEGDGRQPDHHPDHSLASPHCRLT